MVSPDRSRPLPVVRATTAFKILNPIVAGGHSLKYAPVAARFKPDSAQTSRNAIQEQAAWTRLRLAVSSARGSRLEPAPPSVGRSVRRPQLAPTLRPFLFDAIGHHVVPIFSASRVGSLGAARHETASFAHLSFVEGERHHMTHWRKSYPRTTQFNSLAAWAVGASMLAAALVFIARHVYV